MGGLKGMVIVPTQCRARARSSAEGVSKHRSRLWQRELAPSHAGLWQANILTVVYFSALCCEWKKI